MARLLELIAAVICAVLGVVPVAQAQSPTIDQGIQAHIDLIGKIPCNMVTINNAANRRSFGISTDEWGSEENDALANRARDCYRDGSARTLISAIESYRYQAMRVDYERKLRKTETEKTALLDIELENITNEPFFPTQYKMLQDLKTNKIRNIEINTSMPWSLAAQARIRDFTNTLSGSYKRYVDRQLEKIRNIPNNISFDERLAMLSQYSNEAHALWMQSAETSALEKEITDEKAAIQKAKEDQAFEALPQACKNARLKSQHEGQEIMQLSNAVATQFYTGQKSEACKSVSKLIDILDAQREAYIECSKAADVSIQNGALGAAMSINMVIEKEKAAKKELRCGWFD